MNTNEKTHRKCQGKCKDTYYNPKDIESIKVVKMCLWCWKYLDKTERKDWLVTHEK